MYEVARVSNKAAGQTSTFLGTNSGGKTVLANIVFTNAEKRFDQSFVSAGRSFM